MVCISNPLSEDWTVDPEIIWGDASVVKEKALIARLNYELTRRTSPRKINRLKERIRNAEVRLAALILAQ
jgi:hypothetical protein